MLVGFDPEEEIGLFYDKYHKTGKFEKTTQGTQEQDDFLRTPGFFEALGRAVDRVQSMVCSDADAARRDEPHTDLCSINPDASCSIHPGASYAC